MDTLSVLPGEALYKMCAERYGRLQDTVGGLLSLPLDELRDLLGPVRNHLVLQPVFLKNWREVGGFYVNNSKVTTQVIVDAIGCGREGAAFSCSTLALDVSDQDGFAGRLTFSRGLVDDPLFRISQLFLYPDYNHPVIKSATDGTLHRSQNRDGLLISAQEGVSHDDLQSFERLHTAFHAVLPNILDIPMQQRIRAGQV